jgi:DNA-binding IclR family transcriptional regulator
MPQESPTKARQGIQVIARAASVLRALEGTPEGLSLGEIAQQIGLPRSTVQRIVYALADEGFVIAASPNARVRLGPSLVSLASSAKIDIDRIILPHMKELSKEIEETVDLSVQDGSMMVFIEQVTVETRTLRAVSAVGNAFPIYSCANGKAVLASLKDDELEQILAQPIHAQTPSTITTPQKLLAELDIIRESGIAYDHEEHFEGICALGVALSDPYGRNIALSIPIPSVRFYKNEKIIAKLLLRYRDIIEKALGSKA